MMEYEPHQSSAVTIDDDDDDDDDDDIQVVNNLSN